MSAVSLSRHSFEHCWGCPLLHCVCRVSILKPVTSKAKASTIQQLNVGALIMADVGRKKWLWGFQFSDLKPSCQLGQAAVYPSAFLGAKHSQLSLWISLSLLFCLSVSLFLCPPLTNIYLFQSQFCLLMTRVVLLFEGVMTLPSPTSCEEEKGQPAHRRVSAGQTMLRTTYMDESHKSMDDVP